MSSRAATVLIIVLAIVIFVLAWFLWTTPASAPTISNATSTAATTSTSSGQASTSQTVPLDTQVTVTTPLPNATVSHSITVAGTAPGAWFFEAQFPVLVKDTNGDTIASEPAHAQGDWMTEGLVTFTDTISVDPSFHGPATLVLLRDNPSGLPQNDDSVTIPITVQ